MPRSLRFSTFSRKELREKGALYKWDGTRTGRERESRKKEKSISPLLSPSISPMLYILNYR